MPQMPPALSNPGALVALCLIASIVIGVNASLIGVLRRGAGSGDNSPWGKAFGGLREQHRQQMAPMDELHRAVADLAANKPKSDQPNE